MILKKNSYNNNTDEELARLCNSGNSKAFATLYDRYFDRLCVFANGFLRDPDGAQDAVQEVFLRFIRQSGAFDPQRKFSTWIYQVTKNHCLNLIRNEENRARIRQLVLCNQDRHSETPSKFDYKQLSDRVELAVGKLNERDRRIFTLRFEEERSIRDIADVTGAPEGTVKSAIFHMLKKISAHIKVFIHE